MGAGTAKPRNITWSLSALSAVSLWLIVFHHVYSDSSPHYRESKPPSDVLAAATGFAVYTKRLVRWEDSVVQPEAIELRKIDPRTVGADVIGSREWIMGRAVNSDISKDEPVRAKDLADVPVALPVEEIHVPNTSGKILRLTRDIKQGEPLLTDAFEAQTINPAEAPFNSVSGVAEVSGHVARDDLRQGEILLYSKVGSWKP